MKCYAESFPTIKWLDVTRTAQDIHKYAQSAARNPSVMLMAFEDTYVTLFNHRGQAKVNVFDASEIMLTLHNLVGNDERCSMCLSDFAANCFSLYYCCSHCRYALCMRCVSNVEVRKNSCLCGVGSLACSYEPVEPCGLKARPTLLNRFLSVVQRVC